MSYLKFSIHINLYVYLKTYGSSIEATPHSYSRVYGRKNVAGKLILNIDGSNERSGQEISENSLLHRYTSGEYKSNTGASSTDGKTRN